MKSKLDPSYPITRIRSLQTQYVDPPLSVIQMLMLLQKLCHRPPARRRRPRYQPTGLTTELPCRGSPYGELANRKGIPHLYQRAQGYWDSAHQPTCMAPWCTQL